METMSRKCWSPLMEPPVQPVKRMKLGGGAGSLEILGDIVGPISDISDWEAAQDPEDES